MTFNIDYYHKILPYQNVILEWESNGNLPKFPFDFVGQKYHKILFRDDITISATYIKITCMKFP